MTESFVTVRCVVPADAPTQALLEALAERVGIRSFFFSRGRQAAVDWSARRPTIVQAIENEEVVVLVPRQRLDEVLDLCSEILGIGRPGRGIAYVGAVSKAVEVSLPEAGAGD